MKNISTQIFQTAIGIVIINLGTAEYIINWIQFTSQHTTDKPSLNPFIFIMGILCIGLGLWSGNKNVK